MAEKSKTGFSTAEIIIIVVIVIVVVLYAAYIVIAYIANLPPFGEYKPEPPDNAFIVNPDVKPFTEEQIKERKAKAAEACEVLANTTNYMELYCGRAPTTKLPDCSLITE
jgi:flagellar basal body-associated protein FliL